MNQDKTLADYIKRVSGDEFTKKNNDVVENKESENDYKVYPEENDYDRHQNPYGSH